MRLNDDKRLAIILSLSAVGLLVAAYQTYEHYFVTSAFCDLSATFSCSVVTGSRFGEFPPNSGIATAAWGVLWWAGMLYLGNALRTGKQLFGDRIADAAFPLFAWIIAGLGFVGYLLIVELYVLPRELGTLTICPLCTVQHVIIVAIAGLGYGLLDDPVRRSVWATVDGTTDG